MAECSSSDSDDEEYIPEDFPSSASDVSEGEQEYRPAGVARKGRVKATRRSTRKTPVQRMTTRQKRGGIHLHKDDPDTGDEDGEGSEAGDIGEGGDAGDSGEAGEAGDNGEGGEASKTTKTEKGNGDNSRIDDLWASFKQDVGMTRTSSQDKQPSITDKVETESTQDKPRTVSIKKTYDFAGEAVEVEKEVQADSKEARKFFESEADTSPSPSSTITSATNVLSSSESTEGGQGSGQQLLTGTKRKGSGISSVLQSIGKKQKLSTLEKSRLDWQKYKTDKGLQDELAHNTKDGYLAKQEFLQRTDQRQFELEREERLKRFKRLH